MNRQEIVELFLKDQGAGQKRRRPVSESEEYYSNLTCPCCGQQEGFCYKSVINKFIKGDSDTISIRCNRANNCDGSSHPSEIKLLEIYSDFLDDNVEAIQIEEVETPYRKISEKFGKYLYALTHTLPEKTNFPKEQPLTYGLPKVANDINGEKEQIESYRGINVEWLAHYGIRFLSKDIYALKKAKLKGTDEYYFSKEDLKPLTPAMKGRNVLIPLIHPFKLDDLVPEKKLPRIDRWVVRSTNKEVEPKETQIRQYKDSIDMFNAKALFDNSKYVFIHEGAYDALSTVEVEVPNTSACALTGVNKYKQITKLLEEYKEKIPNEKHFIITFDNDDAGKKFSQELEKAFTSLNRKEKLNLHFYNATGNFGKFNDANEFLQNDRDGYKAFIQESISKSDRALEIKISERKAYAEAKAKRENKAVNNWHNKSNNKKKNYYNKKKIMINKKPRDNKENSAADNYYSEEKGLMI